MAERKTIVTLENWPAPGKRIKELNHHLCTGSHCHVLFSKHELEFEAGRLMDALDIQESGKAFNVSVESPFCSSHVKVDGLPGDSDIPDVLLLVLTEHDAVADGPALFLFLHGFGSTLCLGKGIFKHRTGMTGPLEWLVPVYAIK